MTYFSSMSWQIMYNMEVIRSLFDHQIGAVSCINGLITSVDFNRLSINLELVIIDFRILANSHPY